jgi:hypothetical protein
MIRLNPTLPHPYQPQVLYKGGKAPPATPSAPPVTERQTEVKQAELDTRKIAKRRKGRSATILAGETGGYGDGVGEKSILG